MRGRDNHTFAMAGLDPAIHFAGRAMDGRLKGGHDKRDQLDLSSAFRIASVIAVVPTLVMPGCMMSPVR